jgi:hypothetical protein
VAPNFGIVFHAVWSGSFVHLGLHADIVARAAQTEMKEDYALWTVHEWQNRFGIPYGVIDWEKGPK